MTSEHAKIIRLARNFPTLEDAPFEPWDPVVFRRSARVRST